MDIIDLLTGFVSSLKPEKIKNFYPVNGNNSLNYHESCGQTHLKSVASHHFSDDFSFLYFFI